MMRRKLALGVVALAVSSAACGGSSQRVGLQVDPSKRTPVELVSGAAESTAKAKTARLDIEVAVSTGDAGETADITMAGRVALDGSRADFTMNMASLLPGADADATVRMLVVDGKAFMDFSALWDAMSNSKGESVPSSLRNVHWVSLDAGVANSSSPSSFTQYLDYLRGASKDGIDEVGSQKIGGVDTRHFKAAIDPAVAQRQLDKQLAHANSLTRDTLEQAKKLLAGMESIPAEVWIDGDGLPRRVTMRLVTTVQGQPLDMDLRMDLSDFGVGVDDITAPPADEVTSMSSLQGALS